VDILSSTAEVLISKNDIIPLTIVFMVSNLGDKDREIRISNKLFSYLLGYLLASVLAIFITAIIMAIINDNNNPISTFCEYLTAYNLVCIGPWALMLTIVLGIFKMKNWMDQRKETARAKSTEPWAQKPMVLSRVSKPAIQKDGIIMAEKDLDAWTLIVKLKDQDASARIEAARELRNIPTPAVEDELTKAMLGDSDTGVRFEAYLALKFQGKDKIDLLLEQLKAGGITNSRLVILDLLRKTGDEKQIDTLTYLYGFETDKAIRLGILENLCKFDGPGIRDLAISILHREDDKEVRLKALDVLRSYDDGTTQEILKYLMGDHDADISDCAGKMLNSIRYKAY
jgi:hypothetical protein